MGKQSIQFIWFEKPDNPLNIANLLAPISSYPFDSGIIISLSSYEHN